MKYLMIIFMLSSLGCVHVYRRTYSNGESVRGRPAYVTRNCASGDFIYSKGYVYTSGNTTIESRNNREYVLQALERDSVAIGYTRYDKFLFITLRKRFVKFCN